MFLQIPSRSRSFALEVVLKCQRRTFKVTVGILVASTRRRTLPLLTGPSVDEGHRNVRVASAFNPSVGIV